MREFWGSEEKEIVDTFEYRGFQVDIENESGRFDGGPKYNPIFRGFVNGVEAHNWGRNSHFETFRSEAVRRIDGVYDYAFRNYPQIEEVINERGGFLRLRHDNPTEVLTINDLPGDLLVKVFQTWCGQTNKYDS